MTHTPSIPVNNLSFSEWHARQVEWSYKMFGSPADGRDARGPLDHVKKEIIEILNKPTDELEWIDAIILAIDGATRAGQPVTIIDAFFAQCVSKLRTDDRDMTNHFDMLQEATDRLDRDFTNVSAWDQLLWVAISGYRHVAGGHLDELMVYLFAKQRKNFAREWPDWHTTEAGKAIEHVRGLHD
jgi:hypothetical protein